MVYAKEMTNTKTDEFEAMLMAAQEERTSEACLKGEPAESAGDADGASGGTIDTSTLHLHYDVSCVAC